MDQEKLLKLKCFHASFHQKVLVSSILGCGGFAFFSYPLLLVCRFLGYTKCLHGSLKKREYYRNRVVARLWLNFFLLDYALYVVGKRLYARDVLLVVDRFILDALIDVMYDTHINPFKTIMGRFLFLFLCRSLSRSAKGFFDDCG
jgi:hypothetical protein